MKPGAGPRSASAFGRIACLAVATRPIPPGEAMIELRSAALTDSPSSGKSPLGGMHALDLGCGLWMGAGMTGYPDSVLIGRPLRDRAPRRGGSAF